MADEQAGTVAGGTDGTGGTSAAAPAAATSAATKDKYLLSSVNNTLHVLDVLCERGPLSLAELSRQTGFDKTTLFRMTYTLERNGYVKRDAEGRWSLGTKLVTLGGAVVAERTVDDVAQPHMMQASRSLGVSVHLGILMGGRIVTVAVENSTRGVQVTGRVGSSARAHSTAMGRAILANLPAAELLVLEQDFEYIQYTDRSLMSNAELEALIKQVRADGYATDVNDRYRGFGGLACPIFDYRMNCVAAAGVVSIAPEIEERKEEFAEVMRAMCLDISRDLGYVG